MRTFFVTTLGCKVNRYESEALSEGLENLGWRAAQRQEQAGLCVINTCAVTGKAAMQSRQAVRKAIRTHPEATVVVTGCYAQITPEVFASMPGIDHIVGNRDKHRIPEICNHPKILGPARIWIEDLKVPFPFQDLPITRFGDRTRAFVKIQDGCNAFCSYCIVPHARGRSRSLAPDVVIHRVNRLNGHGYREVVLCGIHIGKYGQELTPKTSLASLLKTLDDANGISRIRISSIEPMELTAGLIKHLATSEHICPHLHIPLQSGDDDILKAMHRPYRTRDYRDLIHDIIATNPRISVGVDVMAGFPGETDRAFENTYRLIENLPVAYLHVFPFSVREGTAAASLANKVPSQTVKARCEQLRALGQKKREAFRQGSVGLTHEVLVEGKRDRSTGLLTGFTNNYIPVLLEGDEELLHQVVPVTICKIDKGKVFGTLVLR
jgi:threonylcarbamoyladenosine tRNA methylthiotransferase MtaB